MANETHPARPPAATAERQLAAILFTDIAGFSRQMGSNEAHLLRLLGRQNAVSQHAVAAHHGVGMKTGGDAFLVDFPAVVHAVPCAPQIQVQSRAQNAEQDKAEQIHVRIGLHSGGIVQRDGDVFGDGVNIAARLQALAEGERAIALDPNNAESYHAQGYVLIFMGRPEETLRMIEQAMRLNPRYPPLYLFQLGWADRQPGRYAEAVVAAKQFLSRSPTYFPGYLLLAESYVQQWISQQDTDAQVLEQARAAMQRALTLNEADPFSHGLMGVVYLWQKQYEQAIAEMELTISLGPDRAEGYAGLAQALGQVCRAKEAIGMVEQALRRKPFLMDGHLTNVGIAYDLAGWPEEAIALLKQVLTRYPNFLYTHLTLAAVYSEVGKDAEAHAEAAEVLQLNPKFSLEVHKERVPIKDPAMQERHALLITEFNKTRRTEV
jgi:class 3 adenylate cyclase